MARRCPTNRVVRGAIPPARPLYSSRKPANLCAFMATPAFFYQDPLPLGADDTEYRLLSKEGVSTTTFEGREILKVDPEALAFVTQQAFHDTSFFLRTKHLQQVAAILDDPEASENDRYVALTMLRNAEVAAGGILPF